MLKKIFTLMLALLFVFAFAACDKDETSSEAEDKSETSVVSEVSEDSDVSDVSDESDESEISDELSGVVDGTYYGVGYSFDIPEGFSLFSEEETGIMFMSTDSSFIIVALMDNEQGITTITQEFIDSFIDEENAFDFETITVDGKNAMFFVITTDLLGTEMTSYSVVAVTEETFYSINLTSMGVDYSEAFDALIASLTIG